MKKLTRPTPPDCLSKYKHGRDTWGSNAPSREHRQAIWHSLEAMQGMYCAYCESRIESTKRHIDHFRCKSKFKKLTFSWDNLFGSCDANSRCGHHKDHSKTEPYDPNDLVKPDQETILSYVLVLPNGKFACKDGLSDHDKRRAEKTIRVFNLNGDTALVNERRNFIATVQGYMTSLYALHGANKNLVIRDLREFAAGFPYKTIISEFVRIDLS